MLFIFYWTVIDRRTFSNPGEGNDFVYDLLVNILEGIPNSFEQFLVPLRYDQIFFLMN